MSERKRILTGDRPTGRLHPDRGEVEDLKARYRRGKVGDVEVKRKLARAIDDFLEPIRERHAHYAARPQLIEQTLQHGIQRMRRESEETMHLVREAMGMVGLLVPSSPAKHGAFTPALLYD